MKISKIIGHLVFSIVVATAWIPFCYAKEILKDKDLLRDIGAVCYGEVLPEAAVYKQEVGIHPTLLFNGFGARHEWIDQLANDWLPQSVSSLELIACVDPLLPKVVQTCKSLFLGFGDYDRVQHQIKVRLLSAKTGEIVGERHFLGGRPPSCKQPLEYKKGGGLIYKDHISVDIIAVQNS